MTAYLCLLCLALPLRVASAADLSPTHANVPYGPHERNVLDFWQADGDGPRPLLVYIHGGGWTGGDKQQKSESVQPYLDQGISVASINYRYSTTAKLPAPVHDAARAIQFLRTKAADWNIKTDRIALTGGSAGACSSMWLLLHDDIADPNSEDPVLRESTRVCAAAAIAGQTSLDPPQIAEWLGLNVLLHRMIWLSVGEPDLTAALTHYQQNKDLYLEFSPYNHVTADDPPLLMRYGEDMTLPSKDAGHASITRCTASS
jgi:acetyl esterase/lipase